MLFNTVFLDFDLNYTIRAVVEKVPRPLSKSRNMKLNSKCYLCKYERSRLCYEYVIYQKKKSSQRTFIFTELGCYCDFFISLTM